MNETEQKRLSWLKWVIPAAVAVAIFIACAFINGLFKSESAYNTIRIICDCFTVSGAVLAGVGLLCWIASFGQFDILSYGTRNFVGHFIPPVSKKLPKSFYDYRKEKDEKGRKWPRETLFVGLIFLGLAVVFLVIGFIME